jgi:hypothetical protein
MSEQINTDVEKAEATLRDLEHKRMALVESRAADDAKRRAVAFAAHSDDGDKASRAALDKLNAASVRFDSELRSIEDAVAVAQDRLQQARAAEAQEVDREHARELKKLVGDLLEHAAVVDDALADLVTASNQLTECFNRLSEIGIKQPRQEQLAVMLNLSILTSLGQTPPLVRRYFQTLAPSEKRNFPAVMASWCENLTRDADQLLGVKETEAAA